MAKHFHTYKRLVLGLQPRVPDRSMRLAADMAGLLHLELLGLFLEDTNLRDFAAIPFAREIRPLGGGWHRFDLEQLSQSLNLAARNAERMFTEVAKELSIRCQFEVVRGATAETIASISRIDDIVMVVEPVSTAERATGQFQWLVEAAFRSTAAVLLVPTQIARTHGPVVAIAAGPDDPSIRTAAFIALAAKESLVVVDIDKMRADDPKLKSLEAETGFSIKYVAAGDVPLSNMDVCVHVFRALQERLVVMARDVLAPEVATSIVSTRHIPVLVIEPTTSAEDEATPRQKAT